MTESPAFADFVSLACHDLRTPLATVAGFATTLARDDQLGEQQTRYVGMIEAAAAQLGDLVDSLALIARIESGRYEPQLEEEDTLELAQRAAARVGEDRAGAGGTGTAVLVDSAPTETAIAALALAALRHGALDRIDLRVDGHDIRIGPVAPATAPILLGYELRDLGAASGVRLVGALGGSVTFERDILRVALPRR